MKMVIQQFQPAPALRPYIETYWSCTNPGPAQQDSDIHQCLPKGNTELIVNLTGGRLRGIVANEWTIFPEAFLVGLMTEPVSWTMMGQTTKFGISFKPEGFVRIFRQPIGVLPNGYIDFALFAGKPWRSLIDLMQLAPNHDERVRRLDHYLLDRLGEPRPNERYLLDAVRMLREHGADQRIEDLPDHIFIGQRQLQRSFRDFFGLSPKRYSRLIRFRTAYDLLTSPQTVASFAEIAYLCGYADQSHFIRDFKEFTGKAPAAFINRFVPGMTPIAAAAA